MAQMKRKAVSNRLPEGLNPTLSGRMNGSNND
jgi:hypothetical protein